MEKCCENHSGHEARIEQNEKDIKNIYDLIEKVRNRLPHWATLVISILTLAIGWLLSGMMK
jgi:p-aminobenzoyl-glutamate transporter AbgT